MRSPGSAQPLANPTVPAGPPPTRRRGRRWGDPDRGTTRLNIVQHTTHITQHTTHTTQHTSYSIQHTTHNTKYTAHSTQHTTYVTRTHTHTQHTKRSIQQHTSSGVERTMYKCGQSWTREATWDRDLTVGDPHPDHRSSGPHLLDARPQTPPQGSGLVRGGGGG